MKMVNEIPVIPKKAQKKREKNMACICTIVIIYWKCEKIISNNCVTSSVDRV